MSTIPPAPAFKPFNLALVQLGQIGADKIANLKHARDMIRRAASGEGVGGAQGRPDLIVLPVSASPYVDHAKRDSSLKIVCLVRNASTRLTGMCISQYTRSLSSLNRAKNIMSRPARARA
jgi:predicted amidohydrolase